MVELITTQRRLQRSIERALENFKKIGKNNLTPAIVRSRMAALKTNWSHYQLGYDALESSGTAASQSTMEYLNNNPYDNVEDIYQSTLDFMMVSLEEIEPCVSANQTIDSVRARTASSAFSLAHLPPIQLPPFDGRYDEWENFRDRFSALIIQNHELDDFSRMHFLASCLKGRASECIANLAVTADNFEIAWTALHDRFENKRRLLNMHLSALLNLPQLTRESATDLHSLRDKVSAGVTSLHKLNRSPDELWSDLLVHLVVLKVDPNTRKAWNLKTGENSAPPSFDELTRFLAIRARALEECTAGSSAKPLVKTAPSQRVHVATALASARAACPLCSARHYLTACPTFANKSPSERRELIRQYKRCFNCLSISHSAQECQSKYLCRLCHKRHHTMLHMNSDTCSPSDSRTATTSQGVQAVSPPITANSLQATTTRVTSPVLLATAWVTVGTALGRTVTVRALLDQGSEVTFVTERVAQLLRARRIRMPVNVSAVGGVSAGIVRHATSLFVAPRDALTPAVSMMALILRSLTAYTPKVGSSESSLAHLAHLRWADRDPTSCDPIDLIIGADTYPDVILEGVQKGHVGQPIAQNTILGWVLSGPVGPAAAHSGSNAANSCEKPTDTITAHHCLTALALDEELRRFWELEEVPQRSIIAPEDAQCEEHFRRTHSRDSSGRYTVRLPFKTGPPIDIGHSRNTAEVLLTKLGHRFKTRPTLEKDYSAFLQEYESLGHMQIAPASHESDQTVYIPHHPVLREDSLTTKLRVVFNASSATSNGSSLNDHLLAGPKLQTDLPAVILQWRQHKFVYTADIAKMYRQIRVDIRDVDYQRILWRRTPHENATAYQLLTVTYGTACAPFLALRVLRQLVDDEGQRFPSAIPVLRDQVYVDDVLFGSPNIEDLLQIRDNVVGLLKCGGFELRKWASNSTAALTPIDESDHGLACTKQLTTDEKLKVLGIEWNPSLDVFQIRVALADGAPTSKRAILSTIAKIYDPLGWLTPVTLAAKALMQKLWRLKVEWDHPVPDNLVVTWKRMYSDLAILRDLTLPRWFGYGPDSDRVELHGFADASTVAYAAVVYVKVVSRAGEATISLLAGKSRVAPLNPLSIPRLELSAAVLLGRLMEFVSKALGMDNIPRICWTDSTVVLAWLKSHPSRWKTFVANRVAEVQSRLPDVEWHHVSSEDNPADVASRGLLGTELLRCSLWWHGPQWLAAPETEWPATNLSLPTESPPEERTVVIHVSTPVRPWELATRYSSWPKLLRVTGYILRFVAQCRRAQSRTPRARTTASGSKATVEGGRPLSAAEVSDARFFWIKSMQAELFPAELRALRNGQPLAGRSSLVALNPFLDKAGLIRVGGRLGQAPIPYSSRHPILLASHPIVIINHAHLRALHAGLQLTLSTLRQDYWILRARTIVKSVLHHCIVCVRERAKIPEQLMGDLPAARVSTPSRAFQRCGVDYAGPVHIRDSASRTRASHKAYIALFVCMATKAVHLELVGDYSTSSFRNAYSRFCARRGLPHEMYSDNGTTFVGADRELKTAYRSAVQDPNFLNMTAADQVSWNFIPPAAPHFGGLWEAGIKSVKYHLRRVLGKTTLTFEEFATLLCRVEACLNSRPLAPLTDTLENYEGLTPGHFLIGSALTDTPEPSVIHIKENRLSRWQLLRQMTERFWKLWQNDYVNTLQQRSKWRTASAPIKVGQLILVRNQLLPPCKWELGRVLQTHAGPDGIVRVVTVKTAASTYKRPIGKLCVLPIDIAENTA